MCINTFLYVCVCASNFGEKLRPLHFVFLMCKADVTSPSPLPCCVPCPDGQVCEVARDANLKTDLPRYRIYKDGALVEEVCLALHSCVNALPSHQHDEVASLAVAALGLTSKCLCVWLGTSFQVEDATPFFQPGMVGFLLGCSFSFELALMRAGISVRNIDEGKNVSMYKTNIACQCHGPFSTTMVVSVLYQLSLLEGEYSRAFP